MAEQHNRRAGIPRCEEIVHTLSVSDEVSPAVLRREESNRLGPGSVSAVIVCAHRVTRSGCSVGEPGIAGAVFTKSVEYVDQRAWRPVRLPQVHWYLVITRGVESKCFVFAHVNGWQ